MITEDYVSFETAKLLKEKGFDEPCTYLWIFEKTNNPEVDELLNEAEKANNDDLAKEKKMFKKMFKYAD